MSLEKEEELIAEQYNNGEITLEEYNRQIKELHSEYRWMAQEAAQEAYDNEMERW